jgi:geranylgeranyl pyrophosphate synthase
MLEAIYGELQMFIDALLSDFPGSESVSAYFIKRSQHEPAVKQDLLPLLVYEAISGQQYGRAIPLVACWALYLAASHLLDKAQDGGRFQYVNDGVMALGVANVALSQLGTSEDALRDTLDAVGRVVTLGAKAQSNELQHGRVWSKPDYFRNVVGKAAAITATGVWIGGRLATDDSELLVVLKEFGLALGMAIQISDDCQDLAEDLANGTYTLPLIEGLEMTDHPDCPALKELIRQPSLADSNVRSIVDVLENMGAIKSCKRLVRAYQVQAAAVFNIVPGLETYFADYVAPES